MRVSAKELTALILDEERLRTERQDRKLWKSRITGIEEFAPPSSFGETSASPRRKSERRDRRADEEEVEYRLALEASRVEAEEEKKRRERGSSVPNDDDLAKAIKLSKEEEELRKRELEESNPSTLFDDTPAPITQQPQPTGHNQGYQQQGAVDWNGNLIDPIQQFQQPTSTGHLNTAYSNQIAFANQPTGYQGVNSFPNGFGASQGMFDPQQQQQEQQQYVQPQPQQQGMLQPQTTALYAQSNNPYAQAGIDLTGQNALAQQQQQQQQTGFLQTPSNNPWATSPADQQSQLNALQPLPTGSNNPFASSMTRPQATTSLTTGSTGLGPSLNTLTEQKVQTQFNNHNFNPATSFSGSAAAPISSAKLSGALKDDQNAAHAARLNVLLAQGEGIDTFGNTGDLRIPAQHTAPGTFVNSAGQNLTKLQQSQTGNNPFFQQNQFTGFPSATGAAGSGGRVMPAQTGPAGINGFGGVPAGALPGARTNNPFVPQQTQTQPQSGSLIDL